jgi:hypothetical protein
MSSRIALRKLVIFGPCRIEYPEGQVEVHQLGFSHWREVEGEGT